MTPRRGRTCAALVGRLWAAGTPTPEQERPPGGGQAGEHGRLGAPPAAAPVAGDGRLRLAFHDPLADLPDRPAEDGVALLQDAHPAPFSPFEATRPKQPAKQNDSK